MNHRGLLDIHEQCLCGHPYTYHYSIPKTEIPYCVGESPYEPYRCGCQGWYSFGEYFYDLACSKNRTPTKAESPWKNPTDDHA